MVHDKCDATIFGPTFVCAVNNDETEPKMECIEDCGVTMYICDCNVYRYLTYSYQLHISYITNII